MIQFHNLIYFFFWISSLLLLFLFLFMDANMISYSSYSNVYWNTFWSFVYILFTEKKTFSNNNKSYVMKIVRLNIKYDKFIMCSSNKFSYFRLYREQNTLSIIRPMNIFERHVHNINVNCAKQRRSICLSLSSNIKYDWFTLLLCLLYNYIFLWGLMAASTVLYLIWISILFAIYFYGVLISFHFFGIVSVVIVPILEYLISFLCSWINNGVNFYQ